MLVGATAVLVVGGGAVEKENENATSFFGVIAKFGPSDDETMALTLSTLSATGGEFIGGWLAKICLYATYAVDGATVVATVIGLAVVVVVVKLAVEAVLDSACGKLE